MTDVGPIVLPLLLSIFVLLLCGIIIILKKVGLSLGMYLAFISSGKAVLLGPIALIWVLAITTILSALLYSNRKISFSSQFYLRDKWIIPWMIWWWFYTISIIIIAAPSHLSMSLTRNLIMYIILPLPIIILLSKDLKQVKLFALGYIFVTILNGLLILNMGGFNIRNNFLSEIQTEGGQIIHVVVNYHRIALAFGISFILLLSFYFTSKGSTKHLLIIPIIFILLMMFLIGSRQMILAVILVFMINFIISIRTRRFANKVGLFLFGFVIIGILNWLYINLGDLILRGGNFKYSMNDAYSKRSFLWEKGFNSFLESPMFGTSFRTQNGHNLFIGTMEVEGIVGMMFLMVYLYFVFRLVRNVNQRINLSSDFWGKAFILILVFGLLHGQFSGDFISIPHIYWSVGFLWGYSANNLSLIKDSG